MPKKEVVSGKEFRKLLGLHRRHAIEILGEEIIDDEYTRVSYLDNRDSHNGSFKVNVALSAYVTSHARLHLRHLMVTCKDRLNGHDVSSCCLL